MPIDAVFLDGKELPASTQPGAGVNTSIVSALIDTVCWALPYLHCSMLTKYMQGNSLIRGPSDVVNNIMTQVSPAYAANPSSDPTLPCSSAHDLVFQIGGKKFPVDARDFVSQDDAGDATTCVANNVVSTDPPSTGALFSWNLGDPFLKSNMVIFYYGNLTHPSEDPPKIGFVSLVPSDDNELLEDAVQEAQSDGGNFDCESSCVPRCGCGALTRYFCEQPRRTSRPPTAASYWKAPRPRPPLPPSPYRQPALRPQPGPARALRPRRAPRRRR